MSLLINFYPNLTKNEGHINGDQNGGHLQSIQSVGGHMIGDQINSGQLNGGQLLNDSQSSGGYLNGSQSPGFEMIPARDLAIEHIENDKKWKWVPQRDSRFKEAAKLLIVHWLEITARIEFVRLLADTNYAAHLIFKTMSNSEGLDTLQEALVCLGELQLKKDVCVKPRVANPSNKCNVFPIDRSDGWKELELGQFYCDGGASEVVVSFQNVNCDYKKTGLIIAGIEIRPISTA